MPCFIVCIFIKIFLLTVVLINTGSKTLSPDTSFPKSSFAFCSKLFGRFCRSFAISSFETTVISFWFLRKGLSFLATRSAVEEPAMPNFVPEGRLDSFPISLAVTFTLTVLGVTGWSAERDPTEFTVTVLSRAKLNPPGDFIIVPLAKFCESESWLKIVTVPFALSPTSFYQLIGLRHFRLLIQKQILPE